MSNQTRKFIQIVRRPTKAKGKNSFLFLIKINYLYYKIQNTCVRL